LTRVNALLTRIAERTRGGDRMGKKKKDKKDKKKKK
jgi:hypothetical protein